MHFLSPDEGVHPFEELVERNPPLVEPRDESAQGGQTAGEPLYALDVAYRAHVGDGHDFFGVGLDATFGHDVSKQLPLWNPENTFFGIQFDVEPLEVRERCGQVCDQVIGSSYFDHYVNHIDDDHWSWPFGLVRLIERVDLVGEALLHAPLVGGASVFRPKGMVM